jgi:hypothetical protein
MSLDIGDIRQNGTNSHIQPLWFVFVYVVVELPINFNRSWLRSCSQGLGADMAWYNSSRVVKDNALLRLPVVGYRRTA